MKYFITLLLLFKVVTSVSQYSLDNIFVDENSVDSTYVKDGSDSVFRMVEGEYVFSHTKGVKRFIDWDVVQNKPSTYTPAAHTHEVFPVGSVFISVVNTNPNTLLGYGTWETFGAGRLLIGQDPNDTDFDVVEETGGSKTKTISADNLPQLSVAITDPGHVHVQNKNTATNGPLSGTTPDASTNSSAQSGYSTESATTGITATANTGGANTALNIMPPTIVVYMWKRTN